MWLSEKRNGAAAVLPQSGEVTIGGEDVAVMTAAEIRGGTVWAAGGYVWRPAPGDKVLVMKCAGGEDAVCGTPMTGAPAAMKGGEVYIRSNGASLWLKNNGDIEISGNVKIAGRLTVNGNEVG